MRGRHRCFPKGTHCQHQMHKGYVWKVLRTKPHCEPGSALQWEEVLGHFHVVALLCRSSTTWHLWKQSHVPTLFLMRPSTLVMQLTEKKRMSVALDTIMNSLYFAQEVWHCMLKCHPLKVSSKYTEAVREHRQVSWALSTSNKKPHSGFPLNWAISSIDRTSLCSAPGQVALWKRKQSLWLPYWKWSLELRRVKEAYRTLPAAAN